MLLAGVAAILIASPELRAQDTATCQQMGGTTQCVPPVITPYRFGLCDEQGPSSAVFAAWCQAGGGTWDGANCTGSRARPSSEGDITTLAEDFVRARWPDVCSGPTASGLPWLAAGQTTNSPFCVGTRTPGYERGYEYENYAQFTVTFRRLDGNGQCTGPDSVLGFAASRRRSVDCDGTWFPWSSGGPDSGYCVPRYAPDQCPGCPGTSPPTVGNPISPYTKLKVQRERDYVGGGTHPLVFERIYASGLFNRPDGNVWRHTYSRQIQNDTTGTSEVAFAYRANGETYSFRRQGNDYVFNGYVNHRLQRLVNAGGALTGWKLYVADDESTETYDAQGRLTEIEDRIGFRRYVEYATDATVSTVVPFAGLLTKVRDDYGRSLRFEYTDSRYPRHYTRLIDDAGQAIVYSYIAQTGLLNGINYPVPLPNGQPATRGYGYDLPGPGRGICANCMTVIVNENGVEHSRIFFTQDRTAERTRRAGNTLQYEVGSGPESVFVTDPFNVTRTYQHQQIGGRWFLSGISGPECPECGPKSATHDVNGNPASKTDWNDNRTNYTYDLARNLETQRVEGLTAAGATTPQTRTTNTQWHATWRLPTVVAEPLRITTYVYNGDGGANCGTKADGVTLVPGVLCSRTVQATTDANGAAGFGATPTGAPRTWSYTYNRNGSVLTANGPRTDVADVTTYTYYANDDADLGKRGNVETITDAAGNVTTITAYNVHGQPTSMTDANGLVTTMTYDARLRLTSRNVGGEITGYQYDGVGQLTKVTLPDGSFLAYTYDDAQRLTALQDNLGNRIAYTLDAMGNRTAESVFDPANVLAQTRTRVISNLNRLFREVGALGQTTEYGYDPQGNVTSVKDPLNRVTANQYDALNRLKQVTDPASGITQYGYNGLDALTSVSDPRSLVTSYAVDGLGNLTQQVSPDTGTTANTYDAAGNLLTQTDAKGQATTYAYDALNRVTLITFADGAKQAYGYDAGTNGKGRLTSIVETNPANAVTSQIAYAYDQKGRVTSETRTVNGVAYVTAYGYDASGRMNAMTYPSGRTVNYTFDALGRVNQVSTSKDSQSNVVVQNVQYHPFGAAKSWTLGNGQLYNRAIDQDGRVGSYTLGNAVYALAYDAASRITSIGEVANPPNTNTYGYDTLDRLSSAILPGSSFGYSYDPVGNRITKTTGAATETYAYGATSNRLASVTPSSGPARNYVFDANGSTTSDAVNSFAYDTRGRMVSATNSTAGTTNYQVNALGQRIRKTNSAGDVVFHYDTRGRLIAETDQTGVLKREYLYLHDTPVAVAQ